MMDSSIITEIVPCLNDISGKSKKYVKQSKCRQPPNQLNNLPIYKYANEIEKVVRKNSVTIIVAETGCGKSSQVPKILFNKGLAGDGSIVCTQPRRIAAWTLASRVAEEMNCNVGEKVGFQVRFENTTSKSTRITYVTDGILLQQFLYDSEKIRRYKLIIVDEVHERSLQLDLLLGVIKKKMDRSDFKVVIMSATMNTEIFSKYFANAPVVRVKGFHFPVQVEYDPGHKIEHVVSVIAKILKKKIKGDIMVFFPGRKDIENAEKCLTNCNDLEMLDVKSDVVETIKRSRMLVLPAHSELPRWIIDKIFQPAPPGHTKIILATNVAESSVTVEGLYYVVDTGLVNVSIFDGRTGISRLATRLISKSEAEQRKGRVGRTQPGECYRLYNKSQVSEREPEEKPKDPLLATFRDYPQPRVEHADLSQLLLLILKFGFKEFEDFPFISPPNNINVMAARNDLKRLGALDWNDESLTKYGGLMARIPLHPRLAAALLEAGYLGCGYGMLLMASMMSGFASGSRHMLKSFVDAEPDYQNLKDELEFLMWYLDDMRQLVKIYTKRRLEDPDAFLDRNKSTYLKKVWVLEFISDRPEYSQSQRKKDSSAKRQQRTDEQDSARGNHPPLSEWSWSERRLNSAYFYEAVSVYHQLYAVLSDCMGQQIETPCDIGCMNDEEAERLGWMLDVRGVLEKIFAPNVAVRQGKKGYKLPNEVNVTPSKLLAKTDPKWKRYGGITLFCQSDIRKGPQNRTQVQLVPSFLVGESELLPSGSGVIF